MEYINSYLEETKKIIEQIDTVNISDIINLLGQVRNKKGRIFFLGVGGGAGNASHAVNDFRKLACIESYAPTDNSSELTARVNDDGWESVFVEYLKVSKLNENDMVFIFSVGGGSAEKNVSVNLVNALKYAKEVGSKICGIVGRDGGYTAKLADSCVIVPTTNLESVTPHTEAFQAIIWHLIISHPDIRTKKMKWETIQTNLR